mgnify:CR=1 FL=1
MDQHQAVDQYIAERGETAQAWLRVFVDAMRKNHPEIEETLSYQMPLYVLERGKNRNYIAFGTPKTHFSFHTLDFAMIEKLHKILPASGKGKGCVNVKYTDVGRQSILLEAMDEIIERHRAG